MKYKQTRSNKNNKIIIPIAGAPVRYRLEIMKRAFPDLLDYIIIFTTRTSYPMYKDYHDDFEFVFIEDYQDDFSKNSDEFERFPEFETEEEYFRNIAGFEGAFSLDISRFIFPYLMENNIYNFIITETDFIFRNDIEALETVFNSVPEGTLYAPWMGDDVFSNNPELWTNIQHLFPDIRLEYDKPIRMCDGFLRGFHFRNKEDMTLFYNIYCEAMKDAIKPAKINKIGTKLYYVDYVVHILMQIFKKQKNYNWETCFKYTLVDGQKVGHHVCRPEDTFYHARTPAWVEKYNLDRKNVTSIEGFIKKNKKQLDYYYRDNGYVVEVTDTHAFTSLVK